MATERELDQFLRSVELRAFKYCIYRVKDDEAALDIIQDSMLKLSIHYGDKPVTELPMLFQRILTNTTMDWFRKRKAQNAIFSNFSDFKSVDENEDFDILEALEGDQESNHTESTENTVNRQQIMKEIENSLNDLPDRQREAFLLRYWEERDTAETALVMGCTEGSVKTHCSRAIAKLSKLLQSKGIHL